MKIKCIVYAPTAVKQFIYKFNTNNSTKIELIKREVIDGTPFVTINFEDASVEQIFNFAYNLGSLEKYLAIKGDSWLPLDEYPFPPEKEE